MIATSQPKDIKDIVARYDKEREGIEALTVARACFGLEGVENNVAMGTGHVG